MKKTYVIVNPNAGGAREMSFVWEELMKVGELTVRRTNKAGDATELARHAAEEGFERVVAVGGDGTVNEALNGLAGAYDRVELAVLPLGTGNDLARSLGIPLEAVQAVTCLHECEARPVDLVRASTNGKTIHYVNCSNIGFGAEFAEEVGPEVKGFWGSLAYITSFWKVLPKIVEYTARLTFDDEEPQERSVYSIVAANGRYVGGGIPIAPRAKLDDGQLDVIMAPADSIARMMMLMPQVLRGEHLEREEFVVRRARRLRVESEPQAPVSIDGEPVGKSPVEYEVLPRALRVVCRPEPTPGVADSVPFLEEAGD